MKLPKELGALFERDLEKLLVELNSYEQEDDLWVVKEEIKNSSGNLMMHICGNLKHFIGATLDNTGYVRERDVEFSGRVSKSELSEGIGETKEVLSSYFERVSVDDMSDPYPLQPFGYPMTKSQFLIHLYGHLSYHMGQINYHRRLVGSTNN